MAVYIIVAGTGTGVGKTALSALLVRRLRARGIGVAAFKPLCSGGRSDARLLLDALGEGALDVVNPWHFRPPIAPAVAARLAGSPVRVADVAGHVRRHSAGADVAVVEMAGGLLSPLASDGDAPDLIRALRAAPVLVTVDRLGVIHDVRAALACLPPRVAERTPVVLMSPLRRDPSCRYNRDVLADLLGSGRLFRIPRLPESALSGRVSAAVDRELDRLLAAVGGPCPT